MHALTFWKTVTMDQANLLERVFALLDEHRIRYCVIGGQAVNAYAEPVVSLDLDPVVAVDRFDAVDAMFKNSFRVERFPHRLNISMAGSNLRVQVQTDPRYASFVEHAVEHDALGLRLPVASVEDMLKGKVWAVQDPTLRASKRQKDLADIARLLEAYPDLRDQVPEQVLARLV